jgi:hypothetical protein
MTEVELLFPFSNDNGKFTEEDAYAPDIATP